MYYVRTYIMYYMYTIRTPHSTVLVDIVATNSRHDMVLVDKLDIVLVELTVPANNKKALQATKDKDKKLNKQP